MREELSCWPMKREGSRDFSNIPAHDLDLSTSRPSCSTMAHVTRRVGLRLTTVTWRTNYQRFRILKTASCIRMFTGTSWLRTWSIFNVPESPRALPSSGYVSMDANQLIEEEEIPDYRADRFYPMRLGEVFEDRYQVLAELGFGSSSTTWLARDLRCLLRGTLIWIGGPLIASDTISMSR